MESVKEKLNSRVSNFTDELPEYEKNEPYQQNGMAFSMEEVKERLEMLQHFISEIMVEGT